MRTISEIIKSLGGDTKVAREIGAPLTTVNTWKRANYVPAWRVPGLIAMALKKQVTLSTGDFPPQPPRKPRPNGPRGGKANLAAAA